MPQEYSYLKIFEFNNNNLTQGTMLEFEGEYSYYDQIRGISRQFKSWGYTLLGADGVVRALEYSYKGDVYSVVILSYDKYGKPYFYINRLNEVIPLRLILSEIYEQPVVAPSVLKPIQIEAPVEAPVRVGHEIPTYLYNASNMSFRASTITYPSMMNYNIIYDTDNTGAASHYNLGETR